MSIFEDVKKQYIDSNGKARMFSYLHNITLMTSPLPPLAGIPQNKNKIIRSSTLKLVLEFIKTKGLEITMQDGNDEKIWGVWLNHPDIYYGYIPFNEEKIILEGIPFAPDTLPKPIETDIEPAEEYDSEESSSDLEKMRKKMKIADFLRQYTLFQYALHPEDFEDPHADPQDSPAKRLSLAKGRDNFVIRPYHQYCISSLNRRLKENDRVMYQESEEERWKLIVPSEEAVDRLLGYLKVQLFNDPRGVESFRNRGMVTGYYQSLSDFRTYPSQLIFMNQESLERWMVEKDVIDQQNTVRSDLDSETEDPYFLRHPQILDGKLVLVQNIINGYMARASAVAYKWEERSDGEGGEYRNRVNYGFFYFLPNEEFISHISITIYNSAGWVRDIPGGSTRIYLLDYTTDQSGYYAAILTL